MSAIAILHRGPEAVPDEDRPAEDRVAARHCTIVRVEGELDASVRGEFVGALDQALDGPDGRVVVVDLRLARFIGIGAARDLVAAGHEAITAGVDLRLVAGHREIERVLEVTGLRSLFRSYPSMAAALAW